MNLVWRTQAVILIITLFISQLAVGQKPRISFSFDDGSTADFPGYQLEEWNGMILKALDKHHIKSVLFVAGKRMNNPQGKRVLKSWDVANHKIGNHSWTHPYFPSEKVSLADFEKELLKTDSLIKGYSNYYKYFRFPYLKEGNTLEKRDGMREFLAKNGYKNGHVSVDASDWYIFGELLKNLKENSDLNIKPYRDYYLEHIYDRAQFYDSLGTALTDRKIDHVLLLHHNLTSAIFLDDLITHFKVNGWEVIDTELAYKDPFYSRIPSVLPAGESLIWSEAKSTGKYESILRYPAEGSEYESEKMKALGL